MKPFAESERTLANGKSIKTEDVVEALGRCAKAEVSRCEKCPYRNVPNCSDNLMYDAIDVIKEYKLRVRRLHLMLELGVAGKANKDEKGRD